MENHFTIKLLEEVYDNKKHCLWYGGDIAVITYKDAKIILSAQGDVVGNIYQNGEEITRFKDKNNRGNFACEVASYLPEIDTDEKLIEMLQYDMSESEIINNKLNAINLRNNNWWEVFMEVNGESTNDSFVIDFTDNLDDAIKHITDNLESIYTEFCI